MADKKDKSKGKTEKKTSKKWEMYKAEGGKVERKNKTCPKCGPGVFLGQHANRLTCGKCQYTEFVKK